MKDNFVNYNLAVYLKGKTELKPSCRIYRYRGQERSSSRTRQRNQAGVKRPCGAKPRFCVAPVFQDGMQPAGF